MNIHDTITQPWLIKQSVLDNIIDKARAHLSGPKLDLKKLTAELREFSETSENDKYVVIDDTAIINITGVISKKPSYFERYYYGAQSIESYTESFLAATEDSSINRIILKMDTPGGTVPGVQEFANLIYDNRKKKKIIAFTDGMVASAGYWIGAAAHKMILSGDTAEVGSIGVYTVHNDWTKWNDEIGVKVSIIKAGKFKAAMHPDNKMTKDQKEYIQGQIDYLYNVFTRDVAKFRGVSQDTVIEHMADGKIFIGQQALDAGLADKMMTFNKLLESGKKKEPEYNYQAGESENDINISESGETTEDETEIIQENVKMDKTLQELLSSDPVAKSEHDKMISDARADERKKVQADSAAVTPFLSDEYPEQVRKAAASAIAGEGTIESAKNLAAMADMIKEQSNSDAAAEESEGQGDTPPSGDAPVISEDGSVKSEIDMQAAVEAQKKRDGRV